MSGSVMIARSIFDHELFADQPMTEREAWIWLIMEAAWKPRKKRAGDIIADLARGQLAASVRFMASAWRWTPAKVQRFVKRLQNLEMISLKTDTGVSVITICNYEEYQATNKAADTGPIQDRYRTDTNEKKVISKEEEEVKREANASPKTKGSRLADNWFLPVSFGEWAMTEGWAISAIHEQAERFKDYWLARAGPSGVKLDWFATWRNWMRTAKERQQASRQNGVLQNAKPDRAAFGAAINQLANDLSAGTITLDNSRSDPFSERRGGNA